MSYTLTAIVSMIARNRCCCGEQLVPLEEYEEEQ